MTNATKFHPDFFLLLGIPGLEDSHLLLSVLFFSMYISGLAANSILIVVISLHESLHQPMYFFLVMLAVEDIGLSSTTAPKTLSIFWFGSHKISFNDCLVQIFFIHFVSLMESGVLLVMAYDRYVAICHPLVYVTKITVSFVFTVLYASVIRCMIIITPLVFLAWRLPYQGSNVIEQTYCEHMAMARLATASIRANIIYCTAVMVFVVVMNVFLIGLSYVFIIRAVMRLSTSEARHKTSNTCLSHLCVITLMYVPAFFSFIVHRIPHKTLPQYVHILVANIYILIPPMLNPIIYGIRTKEIRQKVVKMFSGKLT